MALKVKPKKLGYTYAVGRRKRAIARVRLYSGKGQSVVNNLPINRYFSGKISEIIYNTPFEVTQTVGKYYVTAKIVGGGPKGQLEALVHGISRTLATVNREKFRSALKKKGLLTRDPRVRERRKVGTGGKARRKKQSPKR